jgi:hypothetical protein
MAKRIIFLAFILTCSVCCSYSQKVYLNAEEARKKYLETVDALHYHDSILVVSLCIDKIVTKPQVVTIRYSSTECYVNGVKLNEALTKKYLLLVKNVTGLSSPDPKEFFGRSYATKDINTYYEFPKEK